MEDVIIAQELWVTNPDLMTSRQGGNIPPGKYQVNRVRPEGKTVDWLIMSNSHRFWSGFGAPEAEWNRVKKPIPNN